MARQHLASPAVTRRSHIRLLAPSLLGLGSAACMVASILSPWVITIPPAHLLAAFGYQTALCWAMVIAVAAALLATGPRVAIAALLVGEGLLVGWFGWSMWVITTAQFARVPYPFVGVDLLGPGWYVAAVGLMLAAAEVVMKLQVWKPDAGVEVWLLAAVPGFGLARLGRWSGGVAWLLLVAGCVYLASLQSPDPLIWLDLGPGNLPTPPPTRAPTWILLAMGAIFMVLGVLDTARMRSRRPEPL